MTMGEQHQIIQNIVKFFGWIAAITAGVSALLSVTGFMLLQSHAHLLGVSRVFHHTVEDYLYQGGNFFITTLFWALPVAIIGNIYIWFAAGIIALYLLGKRFTWFDDITQRLHTQEALQQAWVRWVAILAAAILFLLFINHIIPPSNAQDLLFAARHHPEVVKRATPQETEMLKNQYLLSMLYVILSALILWFITRIHRDPAKKTSTPLLYVYDRLTGKTAEHQVTEKTSGHTRSCSQPSVVCSFPCCSLCNSSFYLSNTGKPSIPTPSTASHILSSMKHFKAKFLSQKTCIC